MHVLVRRLQRAGVYGRRGVYARAWTVCVNEAEVVGMAKAHAVRLDEDTTEWLDRYAEERGTDKGTILRSAIESFRDDCERGVPELRRRLASRLRIRAVRTIAASGTARSAVRGSGMSGPG
jgi:predicted transcriptional regulator